MSTKGDDGRPGISSRPLGPGTRMMAALGAVERTISYVERVVLALALGIMVVINLALIITRPLGLLQVGEYFDLMVGLMPWVAMIGMAAAMHEDRHVGFVAVVNRLPQRAHRAARVVVAVATFTFALVLVWGGIKLVQVQLESGLTTASLGIPVWCFSLSVPVGASLTLVHLTSRYVRTELSDRGTPATSAFERDGEA